MHTHDAPPIDPLDGPARPWFDAEFPGGPTRAQSLAWPSIAAGEHTLLISPTGTGKTLAAFLAILGRLHREHAAGTLKDGLRCVYVSPLRSLGYDVERNLTRPLEAIAAGLGLDASPIRVGVRTGDTSPYARRLLRDRPPHLLITTPESLALLLSQAGWSAAWRGVDHLIVDEVHALAPNKRGADLAVSLERLSALAATDPVRIGLSATCRPAEIVARFLVGPGRTCRVLDASEASGSAPAIDLAVESLIRADEAPHRGLTYRRLLRRLGRAIEGIRTTIVFANTRAFTEKITHDLRAAGPIQADGQPETIAAHHSALDVARRREVEAKLKEGSLRAVVTSTSLELGVDIGDADLSILVGLPGSASRCLQRVGRAGHRPGATTRGVILAATAAELAGAVVTADAARAGRIEPVRMIDAPLDVLCQQLIGMACAGECGVDETFALVRKTGSMASLERSDFDACLDFLAGELAAPSGAFEPEPGAAPRWTAPRIYKNRGRFGVRSRRIIRWYWGNVGTINSEETCRVVADGQAIGSVESAYAERLQPGDKFVLDGRSLEFRRAEGSIIHVKASGGEPTLPRWKSDRQGLSAELALELASFRHEAARRWLDGASALRDWLGEAHDLDAAASGVIEALIAAQEQASESPGPDVLLVEEAPSADGFGVTYTFHAPLGRAAIEPLARASAARLGREVGRDLSLAVADLGWAITRTDGRRIEQEDVPRLVAIEELEDAVLEGLDRGDLMAQRFRHVAATAMMVLKNAEGKRVKVGGLRWVSTRLYPLVRAACPDHPLLRETRREVLTDLLDLRSAKAWLSSGPTIRFRTLATSSPFATAWVDPSGPESLQFESPESALGRLHARLTGPAPGVEDERHGGGARRLVARARGGVVHRGEKTAVIADLHLGYDWARGNAGDVVPAHALAETLVALGSLFERAEIDRLVVAGDLVESHRPCRRTTIDVAKLRNWLTDRGVAFSPVLGNHDPSVRPRPPLSIEVAGWTIAHGHRPFVATHSITGHDHPILRAGGVAARCFLVGPDAIVLPAFTPNAAGRNVAEPPIPKQWRGRSFRCWAAAEESIYDFGPIEDLAARLAAG